MDIGRVLGRALELAWRYKFLWLFGFVMALTGGSFGNGINYRVSGADFSRGQSPFAPPPRTEFGVLAVILACLACLFVIWLVLLLYFRFVARGAMVTAVRTAENGGQTTLRTSWSEGQGYYARLLGLGFLLGVPFALFTILLIVIAILPFFGTIMALISAGGDINRQTGPLFAGGLFGAFLLICCAVLCILVVQLVLHPIYEFAVRAIVLENQGTTPGLALGYRRLRANLGSAIILYVALILARILWSLASAVVVIPLGLLFVGIVVASAALSPVAGILIAIAFGLPLGLLAVFVEGLFEVFESNAWTEGYLALITPPASAVTPAQPAPVSPG